MGDKINFVEVVALKNVVNKSRDSCPGIQDDRHRIGQKDSVNCYYLLGRRTIDQKLYRIIEEKKHISNAGLGAEDNIQTNIVDMMANLFETNEEEE